VFRKGFFQECFESELGIKKNDGSLKQVVDKKIVDFERKMQQKLTETKQQYEDDVKLYKTMLFESQDKLAETKVRAEKDLKLEKKLNEHETKKLIAQEREMMNQQAKQERVELEEELAQWRDIDPVKAIQRERMSYFFMRW
jgi:hypothetical protein